MFIFEKNPKNLQKPIEYSPTDGRYPVPVPVVLVYEAFHTKVLEIPGISEMDLQI